MRNHSLKLFCLCALIAGLSACDRKTETSGTAATPAPAAPATAATPATPAVVPPAPAAAAPGLPALDVGKMETTEVSASGFGDNASAAVAEAMRMAVLQVNGASIDMKTVDARIGIDMVTAYSVTSLRAEGLADAVRTRSGGVIQNFKITELTEPAAANGRFKASISATVAKFVAPADMKKVKLVVAPLRFGSRNAPAEGNGNQAGAQLRQRIQDALVASGRFAVLDRDFSPEVQQELDLISEGNAPRAEIAKLSQAASADLIWIGRINNLSYNRHAKQLRASDRELVSYSGGWSVTQKLVNVATRQVIVSETLQGSAPSSAPTTLGTGVNTGKVVGGMSDELVNSVVASILQRTFPVTVVAMEGFIVVLSQGGPALKAGMRYSVVKLGSEVKDPQTGASLGRVETPCCQIVVDRVTANLSYGHIEGSTGSFESVRPGDLQLRERLKGGATGTVAATGDKATAASSGQTRRPSHSNHRVDEVIKAPPARNNDDKW